MSRVGKNTVASIATFICIVFVLSIVLPFSGAQSPDTEPPVTSATVTGTTGDNSWYKSNVTVALTAIDNGSGVAHTYYRLDSDNIVTYSSSFEVSDGDHTLIFYSDDIAGNTEPINYPHNYINLKVDTKRPVMNMTIYGKLNATTGSYAGNTTVNLTASDNGSGTPTIQYSIDGSAWAKYTGNISIPDGQHTLDYGSFDLAGNVNNSSTDIKVFNPVILTSPACNTWYDHALYGIAFVLPSSVDHIEYTYNNITWYSQPPTPPFDLWEEGKHEIYYRAIGKSGEISDIRYMWFGIDEIGPEISMWIEGSQSSSGWYNGDIIVHLDTRKTDSIRLTEWSWDGTNWYKYDNPFRVPWQRSKPMYFRTFDMFDRTASGEKFIYFAPGGYDQGSMSNSVWINGVLYGPSTGASPSDSEPEPTLTPTQVPSPTPTQVPSPTPAAETTTGSSSPLTLAVLIGVVAIIIVAAAAAYFFMLKKPK